MARSDSKGKPSDTRRRSRPDWAKPQPPDKLILPQSEEVFIVHPNQDGMRLDNFLKMRIKYRSRNQIQQIIRERGVTIEGKPADRASKVRSEQRVHMALPPPPPEAFEIDKIPLEILYEDDLLVVLNKQPNIVVHPSGGHMFDTVINALHLRYRDLEDESKDVIPKLAHRIDRETSGVLVAVKTGRHERGSPLVFENTDIVKEYFAIAEGVIEKDAFDVDYSICKDPALNPNLAPMIVHPDGLEARTGVTVLERFREFTYVRCRLYTGRQHQIRCHLKAVGHPIICDTIYGVREELRLSGIRPTREGEEDALLIDRQALHSCRLTFPHPETGDELTIRAPLPADMQRTLDALRETV